MDKQCMTQEIDLTISHHQIQVRSRDYDEHLCQWGDQNIEQGVIIHQGYITFDPLAEEAFGAVVKLSLCGQFEEDPLAQRRMVVPFDVLDPDQLELLSVSTKFNIDLPLESEKYALYYEVCEADEVYFRLTFVPWDETVQACFLMDDEWGGIAKQAIVEGYL